MQNWLNASKESYLAVAIKSSMSVNKNEFKDQGTVSWDRTDAVRHM